MRPAASRGTHDGLKPQYGEKPRLSAGLTFHRPPIIYHDAIHYKHGRTATNQASSATSVAEARRFKPRCSTTAALDDGNPLPRSFRSIKFQENLMILQTIGSLILKVRRLSRAGPRFPSPSVRSPGSSSRLAGRCAVSRLWRASPLPLRCAPMSPAQAPPLAARHLSRHGAARCDCSHPRDRNRLRG